MSETMRGVSEAVRDVRDGAMNGWDRIPSDRMLSMRIRHYSELDPATIAIRGLKEDQQLRIVAFDDSDAKDVFMATLQKEQEAVMSHRVPWALGHISLNMSMGASAPALMGLPWWTAAAAAVTSGATFATHAYFDRRRVRQQEADQRVQFVNGHEADVALPYSFMLGMEENRIFRNTRAAQDERGNDARLSGAELLLTEDCSEALAHEFGEVVDAQEAKGRIAELLAWLSPSQGGRYFEYQDVLRQAGYNDRLAMDIVDANDETRRHTLSSPYRSIEVGIRSVDVTAPEFNRRNNVLLALVRMDDPNGFIKAYHPQLAQLETLGERKDEAEELVVECVERWRRIGASVEDELSRSKEACETIERQLRHQALKVCYMAMRWDKRAPVAEPANMTDVSERTALWQEALARINGLLDDVPSEQVYLVQALAGAIARIPSAHNDDAKNSLIVGYFLTALPVAQTREHCDAIRQELNIRFGDYLGPV